MTKVLHIEAGKHLYGGAKQVLYLINGLANEQVENLLVCPIGSSVASAIIALNHPLAQVQCTQMKGELDIALIFRLRSIIQAWQPSVVLCHSRRGADIMGLIAARWCKVPVVCVRRVDNTEPAWFAKLKYHAFSKTVCISKAIRNVLVGEGVSPQACEVIRSVVDTQEYQTKKDEHYLAQAFGFTNQHLVIGCFAQLIERKGQANLLRAFQHVHNMLPNSRLLLCGKGNKKQDYQALTSELGLEHAVVFAGFRSDVAKLLPQLTVLAHPAYTEGLGVTLMQASACGIPIVATNAGGISEVVIHEHNGLIIPTDNVDSLKNNLMRVLLSKQLQQTLGCNGRDFVVKNCSIESMVSAYLDLFAKLSTSE